MFSIWEKDTFLAYQDIVIVGGGFTGLWCALDLKEKWPKKKITLLERTALPSGASTRNAGFACFGSPGELMYDAQTMGTDKMLELVEMRFRGLQRIQKTFKARTIDFESCGGFELFEPGKISKSELKNSLHYLNTLLKPVTGAAKTFTPEPGQLREFGFKQTEHLVASPLEGALHPGKLLQALVKKVLRAGVQMLTGIEIKELSWDDHPVRIEARDATHRRLEIRADQMLLCTNAFTAHLLPELDVVPARGQVLVTSPLKKLPFKGTFHADEGFYYFRHLGNRVLLGGARNKALEAEQSFEATPTEAIQQELERYLRTTILPYADGSYTIEHRWAGIMAMGREKLPVIKEVAPHVFAAVRMSGMGVALAPVVGKKILALMKQ